MNREVFASQLRRELSCAQVSPQLRRRVLDAALGKEHRVMKKKLSLGIILMMVLLLFCAAAIAVAHRAGILDFAGRYQNSYVPQNAQSYIQTGILTAENELVAATISELYYDGRIARMTVDLTPKDPTIMLLGPTMDVTDPWQNMTLLSGSQEEADLRTVLDVFNEGGYAAIYSADAWLWPISGDFPGGSGDHTLNEDGIFTQYCEIDFEDDQPQREVLFKLYLTPVPLSADSDIPRESIILECPLTLESTEPGEVYGSTQPVAFPSVGVRIDQLLVEVKPQDLYVILDYTITDPEVYARMENGLWFEFIDPHSTAQAPYDQRLKGGMSGGGSVTGLDGDSQTATRFRQVETLGRNELHDTYTLRAYSAWSKERYETHAIPVEKLDH